MLVGDDRLALCIVARTVRNGDDATAAFRRLSIARLVDCMDVVLQMTAAVRNHAVQRSMMRMTRARRGEIGLDGRGRRHLSVFEIGKILVFVLMNLEGGEKLGIVIAGGETEMRSVVAADDPIIIAAIFGGRR